MKSLMDTVIRSAIRQPSDQLNIIYFGYDGLFEQVLGSCEAQFYTCPQHMVYNIPTNVLMPNNFVVLDDLNSLPSRVPYDLIVCNYTKQLEWALPISKVFHLPVVLMDHEYPVPTATEPMLKAFSKGMHPSLTRVFASGQVRDAWLAEGAIERFTTPQYEQKDSDREGDVLVVGEFTRQDYPLLQDLSKAYHNITILGDNPGISEPYNSLQSLFDIMQDHKIFLNLSQGGRPPFYMAMAIDAGCCIISNDQAWPRDRLDTAQGVILKDLKDCKSTIKEMLGNEKRMQVMRAFPMLSITLDSHWDMTLRWAADKVYIRT